MARIVCSLLISSFLFFGVSVFAQDGSIGTGAAGVLGPEDEAAAVGPVDVTPKAAAGRYGIDVTVEEAAKGQAVPNVGKTVVDLLAQFIRVALGLVATIFFLLMVYAGFLWMTARGVPDQVNTAKKVMSAAIVGVVVIAAAYVIVQFIIDAFG